MRISEGKIKLLAWLNVVIGGVFFLLGLLGSLMILVSGYSPSSGVIELVLSIVIGLLMMAAGIVLIETKKKKYPRTIGWLTSLVGFYAIFSAIVGFAQGITIDTFSVASGIIIGQIAYLLMIISGYLLKKK